MRLTETVEENTRQRVAITLGAFRGEWFKNILYGVPYIENDNNPINILGKADKDLFDSQIKQAILSREGVSGLISYSSTVDKINRTVSVSFVAKTDTGSLITFNDNIQI